MRSAVATLTLATAHGFVLALVLPLLLAACGPARSTQPPPATPTPAPSASAASPAPSPSPSAAPALRDDLADCSRGDVPACDRVAEDWGGRELAPDAGTARKPGRLAGRRLPDAFFEPLPPEELAAWE